MRMSIRCCWLTRRDDRGHDVTTFRILPGARKSGGTCATIIDMDITVYDRRVLVVVSRARTLHAISLSSSSQTCQTMEAEGSKSQTGKKKFFVHRLHPV